MMVQLSPPIPLETPKGKGYAHFMIDYSQEHDLNWVVFIDETGECWTFNNRDVRLQTNLTMGRSQTTAIAPSVDYQNAKSNPTDIGDRGTLTLKTPH